jgi:diguanylate cyclase (GGDEF)-like protein
MSTVRALAVAWLTLAAHAIALAAAASGVPDSGPGREAFEARVDGLVSEGFERPEQALAALRRLQREHTASPNERRVLLQAIGSVEAQAGLAVQAGVTAEQLLELSREHPDGRGVAASNLVRALVAETAGQQGIAAALAQSALPAFQAGCPTSGPKVTSTTPTCDYRSAWLALRSLERRARGQGLPAAQAAHAQAALALAEWAGDARRQSDNLIALAVLAQRRGEQDPAHQLMVRAKQLAAQADDPAQLARISNAEAQRAFVRGDAKAALLAFEEARALAALANAPRLEAQMLNNLSDAYGRQGRPADALRAAERALVVVRRFGDLGAERVLINNAGVAKIGLGRVAEGKVDLARVLELWQRSGETGRQAETLLEFGEALAAAGDARGALDLYHRERKLSAEVMRVNRSVALKELQTRNDAQARQRDIELLERDNALKTEALANRDLLQQLWWLLAAVMLLAITLVALLYRRVRETNQRLAASHVQLRVQSERDPLTNLANRRHFQAVMASLGAAQGFEGALLLVDIDHFKLINDEHGHAAGDQVLVEVAKRLNEAVRSDDLVVRWGGEEFLILAPRAAPEQAEQMAERVLNVLGQTPISVGAHGLTVTVSIGYARFPLPPYSADVPWEQAINLADMALYTAKNQGRNRAVGITSSTASTREALHDLEADFDRAWHDGRVTLRQSAGPDSHDTARAA